jgi:hypothetical protein
LVAIERERIALDGTPAEMVDAEAKDLAAKQLARIAARKAAKKAAAAPPAKAKPKPAPPTETPTQLRDRVRAGLLRRGAQDIAAQVRARGRVRGVRHVEQAVRPNHHGAGMVAGQRELFRIIWREIADEGPGCRIGPNSARGRRLVLLRLRREIG